MRNEWETRKYMTEHYERLKPFRFDPIIRERENTCIKKQSVFFTTYENWKTYLGET